MNRRQLLTRPLVGVDRVAFSPDGAYLAGAGEMERLLLLWWMSEPERPMHLLPACWYSERMWHYGFDPASGLLLVGDCTGITAYDPASAYVFWRVPAPFTDCMMFGFNVSPDGRELLAVYRGYEATVDEIQRWALNGRQTPTRQRGGRGTEEAGVCGVAFLNGTTSFVVAEVMCVGAELLADKVHFRYDMRGRLRIVNAGGRTTRTIETEFESIHQLAVSPDNRFVAAQCPQGILVWDARVFDVPPRKLSSGQGLFTGIAFCPTSRYLAASAGANVIMYDTTTWKVAKTYTSDGKPMRSVCFDPKGGRLAAGSDASEVLIWDLPKRPTRR
jgi:WD40 repeat protein